MNRIFTKTYDAIRDKLAKARYLLPSRWFARTSSDIVRSSDDIPPIVLYKDLIFVVESHSSSVDEAP